MEQEIKREARKQYLKYFRIWFIILGILLVIGAVVLGIHFMKQSAGRKNDMAPAERVYDYADVLTDEEEASLREYIAKCEEKACIDIVLVTTIEDMEGTGYSWETAMMNYADDFYDNNYYGYNMGRGDGVLLLDNWYENQEGSWLSTCGSVYERFGDYEIDRVLDAVYYEVESNPYEAYKAYVRKVTDYMTEADYYIQLPWMLVILGPIVAALVFAFMHLNQKAAKDTTTATTYVAGGRPNFSVCRDDFIRKDVVSRRIETNNGGGGGGGHRSSGGGGSHRSSSGTRHGGGGRRR